jgi:hypothetical protein
MNKRVAYRTLAVVGLTAPITAATALTAPSALARTGHYYFWSHLRSTVAPTQTATPWLHTTGDGAACFRVYSVTSNFFAAGDWFGKLELAGATYTGPAEGGGATWCSPVKKFTGYERGVFYVSSWTNANYASISLFTY